MSLSFTCTTCGEPARFLFPGTAPTVQCGIVIDRGEPSKAWCMECKLAADGERQRELPLEVGK